MHCLHLMRTALTLMVQVGSYTSGLTCPTRNTSCYHCIFLIPLVTYSQICAQL